MGNIAIRIENIGKRYQLGNIIDLTRTFRETLIDLPRFMWHKTKNKFTWSQLAYPDTPSPACGENTEGSDADTPPGTFWALRDINLEIKHGEVVGIIGRNGAGKSTLLKIISRITTPTTGRIELYGRVGSLLEVGTGFHPELSGRENIYLNGAILGMKKAEIDRKFDEIVAFAETDKFLDTPIKKYSSGMRVRLAFAVAAHLDPEILIVDEVLAVGDAAFQKKSLGKMGEVAKEGRTVIFVSHNMAAIRNLCHNCVCLKNGAISKYADTPSILSHYLNEVNNNNINPNTRTTFPDLPGPKTVAISITDSENQLRNIFSSREKIVIKTEMANANEFQYSFIWFLYNNIGDQVAVGSSYTMDGVYFDVRHKTVSFEIDPSTLLAGTYYLRIVLNDAKKYAFDDWNHAVFFEIITNNSQNPKYNYPGLWNAQQYIPYKWIY